MAAISAETVLGIFGALDPNTLKSIALVHSHKGWFKRDALAFLDSNLCDQSCVNVDLKREIKHMLFN